MHWLCPLLCLVLGEPANVAGEKQLFIDRRFIADSENIELHANAAQLGMILDEQGQPLQGQVVDLTCKTSAWHALAGHVGEPCQAEA